MPRVAVAPAKEPVQTIQKIQPQVQDDWELEPIKACLISNPDCEACQ